MITNIKIVVAISLILTATGGFALTNPPPSSLAPVSAPSGPTVYVNAANTGPSPDGTALKPYPTLQQALSHTQTTGGTVVLAGGTYRGPFTVASMTKPVLVKAATGSSPVLSCSETLSGWSNYSGGIYVTSAPFSVGAVFYNGSFLQRARYPLSGFLSVGADAPEYVNATQNLTLPISPADASFLASKDIVNAGVTTRIIDYWYNSVVASALNLPGNLIQIDPMPIQTTECYPSCYFTYGPKEGYGYFLENKLWMMTQPGSWVYDAPSQQLYVWLPGGVNPSSAALEVASSSSCITISQSPNFVMQGMRIMNSGGNGVDISNSPGVRLNQVVLTNVSRTGLKPMSSDPFILDQSTVAHTGSEGILGAMPNPPAVNAGTIIEANTFQNIGVALGPRYVRAAIGFNLTSNSKARIRHNVITGTAYIGIRAPGGSLVERNTITNFCLLADDCGGIYGGWGAEQGARIIDNFIATATANTEGKPVNRQAYVVAAIYLDDNAANFTVSGNIGAYTDYGFMLHNSNDNMLSGNTIFGFRSAGIKTQEDNVRRVWINGAWTNTLDSSGNTFPSMSNNIFQSNIFMSNAGVPNVLATSYLGGLSRLLSLYRGTGNTYINPFNTTQVVHTSSAGVSVGYTYGELVSSGLDSNPQHPFSAQAGSWPVRTEAPALINGTTTDFNSYTTYAPSGSVTKQSVSCPIASESGHCLLYEASSEASSLLVSRNFPVTQGQFYKIHLQVMSGDSSSWFGKAYVRRNGAPYESLNVYNPANSLHLQPAQWMTYNFYFKSNQTLANARIDLELPASGKMIIGAMTVSSVTLHSGDPNMLVQLLVNPDYLTNLAVPCPSGSNCSSWRTVTDTAVGFPVNLLSRQARPIVMGVSVVDVVAPAAPTSVSLTNVANLNLSWPAATDNVAVTGYRIDVSTMNTFETLLGSYNNKDLGNVHSTALAGLLPGTTHYVRLRSYDAAGNVSDQSPTTTIVPTRFIPNSTTVINTAIVYPNPAVAPADPTIRVCPGLVDSLELTIFDVSGRVVNSSKQWSGPRADLSGVGNGQYCYEYVWSGRKSSGVYFAVVYAQASGTLSKIKLKFAVVH